MPRLNFIAIAACSAFAITSAAGASNGRKAQIIIMAGALPAVRSVDSAQSIGDGDHHDDFRLITSRRLSAVRGDDATYAKIIVASDNPLEYQGRSLPATPLITATSGSAIVVPLWMQPKEGLVPTVPMQLSDCPGPDYQPSGLLSSDAERRRQAYYRLMAQVACEHGVPVDLFDALIMAESRYDASALSPKRAYGLTQLMPSTAASLGLDRFDVTSNLRGGARYLRAQIDRFGQYHLALAAYNAGPGRVKNGRVPSIAETQIYVARIIRDWADLARRKPAARPNALSGMTLRSASVATY